MYLYARGEELRQLRSGRLFGHSAHDLDALLDHVVAVAVVHTAQQHWWVLELAHECNQALSGYVLQSFLHHTAAVHLHGCGSRSNGKQQSERRRFR